MPLDNLSKHCILIVCLYVCCLITISRIFSFKLVRQRYLQRLPPLRHTLLSVSVARLLKWSSSKIRDNHTCYKLASSCFKDLGRCDRKSSIQPLKCKANTQSTAPAPCIFNPYSNLRYKKKNSTPYCACTKHALSYFRIAYVYFLYRRWFLHNKIMSFSDACLTLLGTFLFKNIITYQHDMHTQSNPIVLSPRSVALVHYSINSINYLKCSLTFAHLPGQTDTKT